MRTTIAFVSSILACSFTFAQTADRYTFALTGDSIITRKLSVYDEPEFLSMIERIRSADVAFTNIEMLFHDYESYPMASSGGTYMRAQPELVEGARLGGIRSGGPREQPLRRLRTDGDAADGEVRARGGDHRLGRG